MAAITKGTTVRYGIGFKFAGCVLNNVDTTKKFRNKLELEDELGNKIGERLDDRQKSIKLDMGIDAETQPPVEGDNIKIGSDVFSIDEVSIKESPKSFKAYSLTLEKTEYLTLTLQNGGMESSVVTGGT